MNELQKMFNEQLVLIVTGAEHQSSVINSQLTQAGLKPVFVSSAVKALSIIRHAKECGTPIALVLYDHELPEVNGHSFAADLRGEPFIADTNIIIFTVDNPIRHLNEFRNWNISHVLQWPCRFSDLAGAIAEYIPLSKPVQTQDLMETQAENAAYRILCADDNAINLTVLRSFLNIAGYSPDTVVDGAEAVKAVKSISYDLILMDIMMPVMDGVVATLQIRELEKQMGRNPVPIVAVTAHYTPSQRDRYIEAGMNDVIAKPISKAAIDDCLAKWCQRYVATDSSSTRTGTDG